MPSHSGVHYKLLPLETIFFMSNLRLLGRVRQESGNGNMKLALKGHLGIWCHSLPLRLLVVIDLKRFPLVTARSEFNGEVLVLSSCDVFDSTLCSASSSIMEQGGPYTDLQNCSGKLLILL